MRRVALAGFGSIAEHGHLPALLSFPDVEVVAVADPSAERRGRAAALLPHATLFASPVELIAQVSIDILDICSPPASHADLMVTACGRGIERIVCEKPFVLSEAEYERVTRAHHVSGNSLVSVNNWLHSDLYRHVASVLHGGEIGEVLHVALSTRRMRAALGNAGWTPGWRTDPAHGGGGIVLDHGWHQLYLILGWMGAPLEAVHASLCTSDRRNLPVEDEALIDLYFPGGTGQIELSWTATERSNAGVARGSRGWIDIHDDRIVVHGESGTREMPFSGRLTQSSYHPHWFQQMFAETIFSEHPEGSRRNFEEAGVLVRAIAAIYHSAREGGTMQQLVSAVNGGELNHVRDRGGSVTA